MFKPYRKLAKFSLNLERLSCISCRCMKLASKSAMESDSSANDGSKASSGSESDAPPMLAFQDSRRDDRADGRKGVVGRARGLRVPELERFALLPARGVVDDILISIEV